MLGGATGMIIVDGLESVVPDLAGMHGGSAYFSIYPSHLPERGGGDVCTIVTDRGRHAQCEGQGAGNGYIVYSYLYLYNIYICTRRTGVCGEGRWFKWKTILIFK